MTLSRAEATLHGYAQSVYKLRLEAGVAREQARKDLPLSTYTEAYWKCDLHNLLHFLSLRMDSHAQYEIRAYADAISKIVKAWVPMTWEAFCDYRLNALTFSAMEIEALGAIVDRHIGWGAILGGLDAVERPCDGRASKRELREFRDKLAEIARRAAEVGDDA